MTNLCFETRVNRLSSLTLLSAYIVNRAARQMCLAIMLALVWCSVAARASAGTDDKSCGFINKANWGWQRRWKYSLYFLTIVGTVCGILFAAGTFGSLKVLGAGRIVIGVLVASISFFFFVTGTSWFGRSCGGCFDLWTKPREVFGVDLDYDMYYTVMRCLTGDWKDEKERYAGRPDAIENIEKALGIKHSTDDERRRLMESPRVFDLLCLVLLVLCVAVSYCLVRRRNTLVPGALEPLREVVVTTV